MKKAVIKTLSPFRAKITRSIKPSGKYFEKRSLSPISSKFGYDRGNPIDRFWIESFLSENKKFIKGRVLEVTDNAYTKRFGVKVSQSDVLDINSKNKEANIIGDLRNLKNIKSNTYDCIILTHVLGLIDDLDSVVTETHRILKPGGVVLVTSSCFSPDYEDSAFWRFTAKGLKYLFDKKFKTNISTYGNVFAGLAFWVGMSQEELTKKELTFNDPKYPCIVTARAEKK